MPLESLSKCFWFRALSKAKLSEKDPVFSNFGTLSHHCDKLIKAVEGDKFTARVIINTKKNIEGVSYKGEYTINYYRSDSNCNAISKFELGNKIFNQWIPIGKKSSVSSTEEIEEIFKKSLSNKDLYFPFQKVESYHISDVIRIDNINTMPDFEMCRTNNKKMYTENKTLSSNEVFAFTADLTLADFLYDEIDENTYEYKSSEKVYKRKYLFNLWLTSEATPIELKYIELNCEDEIPIEGGLKSGKYANSTYNSIDQIWKKITRLK